MNAIMMMPTNRMIEARSKSPLQFAVWMMKSVEQTRMGIEACQKQLQDVVVNAPKESTKLEALHYLEKQDFLVKVADETLVKVNDLIRNLRIPTVNLEVIFERVQNLLIELEVLNDMNFKVKKSYITFLNKNQSPAALNAEQIAA